MTMRFTGLLALHCDSAPRLGVYAPHDGHNEITLDIYDSADRETRCNAAMSIHLPRACEARLKRAVESFNAIMLAPEEPDAAAEYDLEELPRW